MDQGEKRKKGRPKGQKGKRIRSGYRQVPAPKGYISPAEAAEITGVSITTLYKWINRGQLPAKKVGQSWHIKRDDLSKAPRHQTSQIVLMPKAEGGGEPNKGGMREAVTGELAWVLREAKTSGDLRTMLSAMRLFIDLWDLPHKVTEEKAPDYMEAVWSTDPEVAAATLRSIDKKNPKD